jgi:cadmium resistance protein CadD (predicted permease)
MVGVFFIITALWCLAAVWLVHHPLVGAPIRLWGPRILPFTLIGLGAYIIWES